MKAGGDGDTVSWAGVDRQHMQGQVQKNSQKAQTKSKIKY